jgi:hypothetical protein
MVIGLAVAFSIISVLGIYSTLASPFFVFGFCLLSKKLCSDAKN